MKLSICVYLVEHKKFNKNNLQKIQPEYL